jgi:hypothetical protein
MTRRRYYRFAAVLLGILILGIVLRVSTAEPSGPSHGLPAGNTLLQFESRVAQQLATREPKGFAVKEIYSVRCVMPSFWKEGQHFHCYIEARGGSLGVLSGAVQAGPDHAQVTWRPAVGGPNGGRKEATWPPLSSRP